MFLLVAFFQVAVEFLQMSFLAVLDFEWFWVKSCIMPISISFDFLMCPIRPQGFDAVIDERILAGVDFPLGFCSNPGHTSVGHIFADSWDHPCAVSGNHATMTSSNFPKHWFQRHGEERCDCEHIGILRPDSHGCSWARLNPERQWWIVRRRTFVYIIYILYYYTNRLFDIVT